jgi:HSP20 family protein
MTNIIKRNNGNLPAAFGGLVDSVFQNGMSRFFDDDFWGFKGINSRTQVPVNIRETDRTYEMEVVAPGLRKEDFSVSVKDNMLTVSFEHKDQQENRSEGYLRSEYRMQSFSRSFGLDDSVDAQNITARYADGILHLSVPKKEEAQKITRTIEIS